MKKSFMNNIKNFVDSNVRHRIDRSTNNHDFFGDDLLLVERQFEELRHVCVEAEKRISALLLSTQSQPAIAGYTQNVQASLTNLSSNLSATVVAHSTGNNSQNETLPTPSSSSSYHPKSQQLKLNTNSSSATLAANSDDNSRPVTTPTTGGNNNEAAADNDLRRHKKLPIVGFLKFLVKSCHKLKPDSLMATTLTHCSQLQTQLTKLYLSHEQTIECECLKPIQHLLEFDAPNVIKLKKLFIKSHNDLESAKAKYNGASQKQQQSQTIHHFTSTSYTIQQTSVQQANINKLDQLRKELDEAETRFEQAKDNYATELYMFVARETELVNLFVKFYQHQAEYQQQVGQVIANSLPSLSNTLACTPRKVVFGTPLAEHLRCTGRSVSLVIELCVHLLYRGALNEEGLFRIPGSSVKIKKLKSAINAWFVSLASQGELEVATTNGERRQTKTTTTQPSLLAIHHLFKDIAGQRRAPTPTTLIGGDIEQGEQTTNNRRDDSTLTHHHNSLAAAASTLGTASSTASLAIQQDHHHHFVFDVHTIAGLLKLYLRELPEPLFTYALYQQWIDASVKSANNELQLGALERVIQQLPKANYDNLRHLIRFLHLLTCHCESNKMTSTNLAITMAPSLIWSDQTTSQTLGAKESTAATSSNSDEVQALNIQMSSIGISASLHALVIENLINHSETLFPGPVQFDIPDLDGGGSRLSSVPLARPSKRQPPSSTATTTTTNKPDRCSKSNSPTGLSTASSSSFSSSSTNGSVTSSSVSKTHSRRGGSMEGLLANDGNKLGGIISSIETVSARPMSVHIPQISRPQQGAPPIPPAPTIRSRSRQQMAPQPVNQSSSSKPAPPPPPPATYKRQLSKNTETNATVAPVAPPKPPQPASCRGSGRIEAPSPTSSLSSASRPTVPPPNRPDTRNNVVSSLSCGNHPLDQVDGGGQTTGEAVCSKKQLSLPDTSDNDNRSSQSVASSGNLRADFEEINVLDVDDIDISVPSVSPVVSLGSITGDDDDSSFDNDCRSLDHSWTDMSEPSQPQQDGGGGGAMLLSPPSLTATGGHEQQQQQQQQPPKQVTHSIKPAIRLIDRQKEKKQPDDDPQQVPKPINHKEEKVEDDKRKGREEAASDRPPVKPPRSISPKITQSTPL